MTVKVAQERRRRKTALRKSKWTLTGTNHADGQYISVVKPNKTNRLQCFVESTQEGRITCLE
ncbi:MAG: hypothetical protein ACOYEQ_05880 [Bacillota bacterium]